MIFSVSTIKTYYKFWSLKNDMGPIGEEGLDRHLWKSYCKIRRANRTDYRNNRKYFFLCLTIFFFNRPTKTCDFNEPRAVFGTGTTTAIQILIQIFETLLFCQNITFTWTNTVQSLRTREVVGVQKENKHCPATSDLMFNARMHNVYWSIMTAHDNSRYYYHLVR